MLWDIIDGSTHDLHGNTRGFGLSDHVVSTGTMPWHSECDHGIGVALTEHHALAHWAGTFAVLLPIFLRDLELHDLETHRLRDVVRDHVGTLSTPVNHDGAIGQIRHDRRDHMHIGPGARAADQDTHWVGLAFGTIFSKTLIVKSAAISVVTITPPH
jgi:hypothetical protein